VVLSDDGALLFSDCPISCARKKPKRPPDNPLGCDECPKLKREEVDLPQTARQYLKEFCGDDAEMNDAEFENLNDQLSEISRDSRQSGEGYPANATDIQMLLIDIYRSEQHKAERRYLAKMRKERN